MADPAKVPLSVLDLATVADRSSPAEALANSVELARRAERLGYRRHWVAEHHNLPGIASSAPAVLAMRLADATESIRIGSGGVMLPNHAPLVVAEQFGTLESLHPGRIDLGIGRAPGTDPATAAALRRTADPLSAEDFPEQLGQLMAFLGGSFPAGHPYAQIEAVPGLGSAPELWLLGSSGYSARLAGLLGLPFSFAHHFSPANTEPALELYRRSFQPSETLAEPHAMVAAAVVCAEDDERAEWLSGPSKLSFARLRAGRQGRFPSPEEAAAHTFSARERELIAPVSGSLVSGGPASVRAGLSELIERTGADELMVTTMVYDQADRLRSYELVAGVLDPSGAAA